jgi:hypothetical protein
VKYKKLILSLSLPSLLMATTINFDDALDKTILTHLCHQFSTNPLNKPFLAISKKLPALHL